MSVRCHRYDFHALISGMVVRVFSFRRRSRCLALLFGLWFTNDRKSNLDQLENSGDYKRSRKTSAKRVDQFSGEEVRELRRDTRFSLRLKRISKDESNSGNRGRGTPFRRDCDT